MAWVYILRGGRRYYIGATDNLARRLAEHQRGSNHTTHRFGAKLELVGAKQLPSMIEARALELQLKRKKCDSPDDVGLRLRTGFAGQTSGLKFQLLTSAAGNVGPPWVCRAPILLDGRMPIVPIGGLFVGVSEAQNRCFTSRRANDLHADRQSRTREPARNGDRGQSQRVNGPRVAKHEEFLASKRGWIGQ